MLCIILYPFLHLFAEREVHMTLSQMQYYKQQHGYSYDQLSQLTGIPKGTIQKIFTGVRSRQDTIRFRHWNVC